MPLTLYVPTRGRVGRQKTIARLPDEWKERTVLFCPKAEIQHHKAEEPLLRIVAQPDPDMSIANKRAWMFRWAKQQGHDKIMMMDDDLHFNLRKVEPKQFAGYGPHNRTIWKKLRKEHNWWPLYTPDTTDPRLSRMFKKIEDMLDHFAHGGISPRQMNPDMPGEWEQVHRCVYTLAYHVPTVLKVCELGRIQHREDMDYTLQLLRAGFANAVYCYGATNHTAGYGNMTGGTSGERKLTESNADAEKLAKLHPGLVKVVEKDYTYSVPRKEVIVYWKKAFSEDMRDLIGGGR